jgi:hypothetical protein
MAEDDELVSDGVLEWGGVAVVVVTGVLYQIIVGGWMSARG